jgi:pimeloyl-ACP methyl ester carboxylesterase
MNACRRAVFAAILLLGAVALLPHSAGAQTQPAPQVESRFATANGVKLHYLTAGKGSPILLLHGYAETSHMWRPLIAKLAAHHTVIAPDLRGAGQSEKPQGGYEKKLLAHDVHALMAALGHRQVRVVGHDIGLMVAYAYAAQYPGEVETLTLMDAFLPGVGNWKDVWLLRDLWHFHFYGEVPLQLVAGRERIYFEHFWNDFAADRHHSIPEADRRFYAAEYARPGGMRAGFEYFRAFEQDAKDLAGFAGTKLTMPVLVLTGEKASGPGLIEQTRLVATNVRGVIVPGSGHWLMEEAPEKVIPELVAFLDPSTPPATAGTSGARGTQTEILHGDPTRPGLYSLRLRVPPDTRIEAHLHPDDRICTVLSGTWSFGYGERFDEAKLETFKAGASYSERPGELHFARTGKEPVVVQITGMGPTGTTYP